MKSIFQPEQFTPTQWSTAQDKAKFANHFVRFVNSGFKQTLFYDWFYRRLSMTFGNIAEYNRMNFWEKWFGFESSQQEFLENCMRYPCYGDATHTYCDVERALIGWLKQGGI